MPVCTANGCSTLCSAGASLCTAATGATACVDLTSDNANCGACNKACGPSEYCNAKNCVPLIR